MSDFPAWYERQQDMAKSISGEALEKMGKEAASIYRSGRQCSLREAIVSTVKSAGLSPEQVKRVVEFANTEAYLGEFREGNSAHRVIEFPDGPASPSDVLQDLNDGGGGSVNDSGTFDYSSPPEKKAANTAEMDAKLASAFGYSGKQYPEVNPYQESYELRTKVAAAFEKVSSDISDLEIIYDGVKTDLYHHVKQAMHQGYSLGQIVAAWQPNAADTVYVKLAFDHILPRLEKEGMGSPKDFLKSLEKTAADGAVNTEHPLVRTFGAFQECLYKLASLRVQQGNLGSHLNTLNGFIQKVAEAPSKGLIGSVLHAAETASKPVGRAARATGELLLGSGEGANAMGQLAEQAVKHAPHMAAAYGVYRAAESPLGQRIQARLFAPDQPQYYGM